MNNSKNRINRSHPRGGNGYLYKILTGLVLLTWALDSSAQTKPLESFIENLGPQDLSSYTELKFAGTLKRGEVFAQEILPDVFFQLQPMSEGWHIVFTENDFSLFTLPLRGINPKYISTEYGFSAKETVANQEREFNFVLNQLDYRQAYQAWTMLLWPQTEDERRQEEAFKVLKTIPMGKGKVLIDHANISASPDQPLGQINQLDFSVYLWIPKIYLHFAEFLSSRRNQLKVEDPNLMLSEFYIKDFTPGNNQAIVIWRKVFEQGNYIPEKSILEIYEQRPGGWELIASRNFESLHITLESQTGLDITGDSLKDIVLRLSTGGNCWGCEFIQVNQLKNGELITIPNLANNSCVPISLEDLDGDGIWEMFAINTRFEFAFGLCHACSPASTAIYTYTPSGYVDNSHMFPEFYEREIAHLIKDLPSKAMDDEFFLRDTISLFLNYVHKGESHRGFNLLETKLSNFSFTNSEWRDKVPRILCELKEYAGL